MAGRQQLRLLLWKDYLMRKRKLITLAGVLWATAVMLSLYIVRANVDNEDYPTCGFPARALLSAGMLPFLQSFMCTVNNECSPLDQYDEIPTYENSKLTQVQRKLSPIMTDSVLDVAATVPDAIKLLATLADVVDQPTFIDISKNGLKVRDLFVNSSRVKRMVSKQLQLDDDVMQSVMDAEISFQGLLKGNINRCSASSLNETIVMNNEEHLDILMKKLCTTPMEDLQKVLMDALLQVNYSKYLKMLGDMYYKLSGDGRLNTLGKLLTAVLRMMRLQNFLPPELVSIFMGQDVEFSYFQLNLITKLVDLFKNTYGDTQSYGIIKDFTDAMVVGLQYLDKVVVKQRASMERIVAKDDKRSENGLQVVSNVFYNAADVFNDAMEKDPTIDVFSILAQAMNFINKFLPAKTKHDVLFYSTLLAKLMESAHKVIDINMHIEQLTYNVTLRHPKAVEVLKEIPPKIVGKAFEALADAERTQILTSKINYPGQMFCDIYKLQTFFVIPKTEAETLKKQFCTDAWKNYVTDLIKSFGVFDVKNNINNMASLLIQETLGKDTSDQLYPIDQDFKILKNFTHALMKMDTETKPEVNWNQLFNVSDNSELVKVARSKAHLGKQMLIVIHGAIAKEIVQQNPILDFKISPYLQDVIILTSAINEQLKLTSETKARNLKGLYPELVVTMLRTALDEEKTYKSLSTPGEDIMCNGVDTASEYLVLPTEIITRNNLVEALCDATNAIESGLKADSVVSKAIATIKNSSHSIAIVNWNSLINNIKELYINIDRDYPYLFQFSTYNMDGDIKGTVDELFQEAKEYWFGKGNFERSLRLSVKLGFRFLDVLDAGLFAVDGDVWLKIKYAITITAGPIHVFDDTVQLVTGLLTNSPYTSELPPRTVAALTSIIPNMALLTVDAIDVILRDNTDVEPIISLLNSSPPWPCSITSISELLELTPSSKEAVVGVETILCMDDQFVDEWNTYLVAKNATVDKSFTWNSTTYEPHLFLKFSSNFDAIVNDVILTRDALQRVFSESADGTVGLKEAWNYAVNALSTSERHLILRRLFTKIDTVLNSVNTSSTPDDVSVSHLWERVVKCDVTSVECRQLSRAAWKNFFESFSVTLENIATDLMIYFTEINEPNSNLLQMFGFTRKTGLYSLYDKMAEFMGVLLNSYWDFGFMSQVRRASYSQFWDCEAVMTSLVPPPGSAIDKPFIDKIKPFICPSLFHWLSLPRGENTLLDVFAKPQYFFFTLPVKNLTSRFENAYTKAVEVSNYLTEMSQKNQTLVTEDDMKMNSIQGKFEKIVDAILYYKINETDAKYKSFNEINMKQFALNIYLTKIVAIINKLYENVEKYDVTKLIENSDDVDMKSIKTDFDTVIYLFKRKPADAVNIHFDILTDVLWNNEEEYSLVDGFNKMCNDLKSNDSKTILVTEERARGQVCAKRYAIVYGAIQNEIVDDLEDARKSLMYLVDIMKEDDDDFTGVFEFFNNRQELITSLRTSTRHSYELGIPIYLKYLQSNIQSYDVILSFLSGEDWWQILRNLYNGPYANKFFGYLENTFEVVEDLLTNFDGIHLVRLLHDMDVNQTDSFCAPNLTLSDYVPDRSGMWTELKHQLCSTEKTDLYKELPPLMFASQGYDNALKVSKDVDYAALQSDISKVESRLDLIRNGPRTPMNPAWVTDEKVESLRKVALKLLSKETLTKIGFAVLSNGVDAGTLFLNNSLCTHCSSFTTWFKQLNLQLFKKADYDNLLCHLHTMNLSEVYATLKNDFHWDMAVKELISTRNYTKYELNKSMSEFIGLVKLYILEEMSANSTKLTDCLLNNVTNSAIGNVTLFATVLAQTATLIRAELPHLQEVDGIKTTKYLSQLYTEVAHNLDVVKPLKEFLVMDSGMKRELMEVVKNKDLVENIENGMLNLRKVRSASPLVQYIIPDNTNWYNICETHNCSEIDSIIIQNINMTLVHKVLPDYQTATFWSFDFLSTMIHHLEKLVVHGARLLGVASRLDVEGVMDTKLEALLDTLLVFLDDNVLDTVLYSLRGMTTEMHPLLEGTTLEHDLEALASGLTVMKEFKNYLIKDVDLEVDISTLFPDGDRVESGLSRLGINNTNFWSIAAPRIRAGRIMLKPLLVSKPEGTHISTYVCQMEAMSSILSPGALDVVTSEDVYGAVIEQLCGLPDKRAKEIVPVLLREFNFSVIVDKVANILLTKLYSASNLTEEQGATVVSKYSEMAALIPTIQANMGDIGNIMANETIFKSFSDFSSVGNLLGSPEFLSSAGNLMCGKPFQMNTNRFYKSIASTPDLSTEPDQAQLDVLPTDFCRSLYRDIINVEGGKIVWSFVKPLIMGKILYTPANPTVNTIIQKANSTFSTMIKLTSLIHSFAGSFPAVSKLSVHRAGIQVLRRVMSEPQFRAIRNIIISGDDDAVKVPDVDVDGLFEEFGDLKSIGSLLSKASDLLHCINLNRFQPSDDEEHMTHEAARLSIVNEFSAGVVFLNSEEQDSSLNNVQYKIRMDIDNAPTTVRLKDYLWIPGPESSFIENMRYFRGFIQIQDLIDKAIITLAQNHTGTSSRNKRETSTQVDWAIYTQQTPYPCYRKDYFQTSLYESQTLIVAFFFSLLFTVASAVRFIVHDHESGNTMLMSVMGVDLRWHSLSWFISCLVEMSLTCICITLVLNLGHILPTTDPTLVFSLLFVFGLSVLSFCYMLSKLFTSASLAAVCAAILYLVTFMPFVIILSLEAILYTSLKMIICISMSSSVCYAFLYITRFEAHGSGAGWAQLWVAPDEAGDMSIGLAGLMLLFDAVLYFVIGWLVDRYYGIKTLKSNITYCSTSDEKAGVSIVNVTQIYGFGTKHARVALDNVSMELHKGQLTTLLGHNGAGKTTLINILTGMARPTKGHVVVRGHAGSTVGVCPQRDVLWTHLTPYEHIVLYARLNTTLSYEAVQEEVHRMLEVLSLGPVANEPVSRLSGGTRRRLCVALAFVGKPHLVSLDEPTSGVDPAARRDIWSMIVKLKEDRTILLTTHHLDEAELLSDQIVIMHKGQIHTTGSPIEIKRTLGNGYKLTVIYPQNTSEDHWEETTQEEKTKQLLTVVRDVVKNANVVDVSDSEVEIGLPFFDANGLNNNYLQLCTVLEASQSALGFKSYIMDCSSLEQVFFNVCQQADQTLSAIEYVSESTICKSTSSSSSRSSPTTPLVPPVGTLTGSTWEQFTALMHARYLHHVRNRWLLFLLIGLPSLFVIVAMGFSMLRPPADSEISLKLDDRLYKHSTQFIVPQPSIYNKDMDPAFAEQVLKYLMMDKQTKTWTPEDSPTCVCRDSSQHCDILDNQTSSLPEMMVLPDTRTLNNWLVNTHEIYIEKRYGGFTSTLKNNLTNLIAWYNNKGHHAMPAYMNAINSAVLRTLTNSPTANITTYTHPLKISKEQISKATVYQHIADAGISGLVLIAYCLVSAGAAIYLVAARRSQEKRLQLLCGLSPALYWGTALVWDMMIIGINIAITSVIMSAFGFPVFVERNNLAAICVLFVLYGYACGALVHVCEKLFSEASMANMILFCGNAFLGLAFLAILLIFDIISESEATDNARWVLHKIFLLMPQFALGDGLLEIAKNTIQAQVLNRFGMDTYKDPLRTSLVTLHFTYLLVVGTVLLAFNLAIEYDCFEILLSRFRSETIPPPPPGEEESQEVNEERKRVHAARLMAHAPVNVSTIGNINRGYVHTEDTGKKGSMRRYVHPSCDAAQCVELSKCYRTLTGYKVALRNLTLGIPPGQCTALLGENGAGKSTTFSMLTGELRPTAGDIYLDNQRVNANKLCKGLISYCPQNDAIDPLLTVTEILRLYCRLRGISDQEEVIKRSMEMFDLVKYGGARSGTLSGGNKRKLCTAIAFMARTPLVLLDEPTSGMDPVSRSCVSAGVRSACVTSRGVLLATHALGDARRLAARVALLRAGRLVAAAPLDDCLTRFGGGYVVACRSGSVARAWRAVTSHAPHAQLQARHSQALTFLIPTHAIVNNKEIRTSLSDIFRLMAELQGTCDVEDYTINQSSLEQMFLSFTDKPGTETDSKIKMESLPTPYSIRKGDELDTVTSL